MTPVRYSAELEQPLDAEPEVIDEITGVSTRAAQHVADKRGHAMRATHAKATGLLTGELTVEEDLPPELAQGLFGRPGRYEVIARFSQGPSEPLSDQASGQRGLSVKVLGVGGAHLRESRETTTQDFVLAPDPAFVNRTAQTFLANFEKGAGRSTSVPESVIVAGSKVARGAEAVLETVRRGADTAHARPDRRSGGRPRRRGRALDLEMEPTKKLAYTTATTLVLLLLARRHRRRLATWVTDSNWSARSSRRPGRT